MNNDNNQNPTVGNALVRELVVKQGKGKDSKRCSKDAVAAAGELLRLFILEARNRASIEAECEPDASVETTADGKTRIRADHVAKIAAELLMDFS